MEQLTMTFRSRHTGKEYEVPRYEGSFLEMIEHLAHTINCQLHYLDYKVEEVASFYAFSNHFLDKMEKREQLFTLAIEHVRARLKYITPEGRRFSPREQMIWEQCITYPNYDFGSIRGHLPEDLPAVLPGIED